MTSGRRKVDRWGGVPNCCNTQTLMLVSFESTKKQAVLMLPLEHSSLKSLNKIIQERPIYRDSLSGTAHHLST